MQDYKHNRKITVPSDELSLLLYLPVEGEMIKWWLITNWIIAGILICCFGCCFCICKGIRPTVSQGVAFRE